MDVLINGEIVLYGTVGARFLPDVEYFNDVDVKTALTKIGKKDVNVRINSGGGIADNGVAIYNLLKEHPGKVKVSIDGVAASAASVIAMAGDTILMRTGALMMVHKAQSFSIGNSDDHQKQIDALKAVDGGMVDIYAQRTGRPRADIEAEMAAETWMNGDQAVSKKYATGVETSPSMRAAAFDYRLYSHAPERMVALAAMLAGEWTPPPAPEPPHTKFWQFIKSHGKAAAALAAAFDAEFKGQPLASNIAFAEIWNAAQRGDAAADWVPTQRQQFVSIDDGSIVQAEAIRREMTEMAAACAMMGKPERVVGFIQSGSSAKAAVSTLQAERVASQEAIFSHATGMTAGGPASGRDQGEIDRGWAAAIDTVNKRYGIPTAQEIYAKRAAARQARMETRNDGY